MGSAQMAMSPKAPKEVSGVWIGTIVFNMASSSLVQLCGAQGSARATGCFLGDQSPSPH
jgi:hypothetical protein